MSPQKDPFDAALAEQVMSNFGRFLETDPDGIAWLESIRRGFLKDAIDGNHIAAKWVIWAAVRDLRQGVVLSPELAAFLADALEIAVANPKAAARALGLTAAVGPPKKNDPMMDWRVARRFEQLMKQGLLRGNDDSHNDGTATARASQEFGLSPRTVRRHLEDHSRRWRELDNAFTQALQDSKAINSSE